jgi:hypothetical protein
MIIMMLACLNKLSELAVMELHHSNRFQPPFGGLYENVTYSNKGLFSSSIRQFVFTLSLTSLTSG